MLPIFTCVVWTGCAVVGLAGLGLHYPWPQAKTAEPPPVLAETPVVRLPKEEPAEQPAPVMPVPVATPEKEQPSIARAEPRAPSAPPPLALPDAPAFTPVAAPSDTLAFAVPVAGPTRVVLRDAAASGRTTGSATGSSGGTGSTPGGSGASPAPFAPGETAETLVLGDGKNGKQEPPEYPREAQRRRQEGSVTVLLRVDEGGWVRGAEIETPCKWPLLNQAALNTVRHSWCFPPGGKRLFRVAIHFKLSND